LDGLVPAFVAALIAGFTDRAVGVANACRSTATLIGVLIGIAGAIALAVAGAMLVAPLLAPNARTLFVALALVTASLSGWLVRRRAPIAPSGVIGAMAIGFVGIDATAFIAFALATASTAPALVGIGSMAAIGALVVAASLLDEEWRRLPLKAIRRVASAIVGVSGIWIGLGALRLI
jgi:hypothetical protein